MPISLFLFNLIFLPYDKIGLYVYLKFEFNMREENNNMKLNHYTNILEETLMEEFEKRIKEGEDVSQEKIESIINEMYSQESIKSTSLPLYENLIKDAPKNYEHHRLIMAEFESRLQQRWLDGLYTLQSVITISEEVSVSIINEYIEDKKEEDGTYLIPIEFDILVKLQAKAIVTAKEIFTLLKSGFPDAALSRWRGLHEINVIFTLLCNALKTEEMLGKELTQRFWDTFAIERYKIIQQESIISKEFGEEYKEAESEKEAVEKKYGKSFSKPYEWARPLFKNKGKKQRIYFSDLEKEAERTIFSSYYKEANNQVHSTGYGIYRSLGGIYHEKVEQFGAVFGPSNYGLSMPGQLTVISLAHNTTSFLLLDSNLDKLIISSVLNLMIDDAQKYFDSVQSEIFEDELSYSE